MSIEKATVIARIKAKHPKTNLSNARLDEISARLIKKLNDDADETAIDALIDEANDYNPFTEIAKNDDKIRDLEVKAKKKEDKVDDPNPDPLPSDLSPELKAYFEKQNQLIEGLTTKLTGFEQNQTKKTLSEKFTSDERVKNIPAFIRDKYIPADETKFEDAVTELTAAYTPFAQSHKIESLGNDAPAAGTKPPAGNVKPASQEQIDAVVKKIV